MRAELQRPSRPTGIIILTFTSVIVGVFLIYGGLVTSTPETEKEIVPGYTLGFLQVFFIILLVIGSMYVLMGIGLWKAHIWALRVYRYVNYAITITTIFYGALIDNPTANMPLSQIGASLLAIMYGFAVNRYLHNNNRVKLYFGETSESTTIGSSF